MTSSASDGRPNLYDAQCAAWESVSAEEEQYMPHLVVETTLAPAVNVEHVRKALHIPPISCRLQSAMSCQISDDPLADSSNKM